jgi:hypothetical protein
MSSSSFHEDMSAMLRMTALCKSLITARHRQLQRTSEETGFRQEEFETIPTVQQQ